MQQRFILQILVLAQHVSGITMPIIRSSRVLYSGCCLWYFVLWFSSWWSGVELRVMCPVCRMLQHPTNRTHNPQLPTRPGTWKPRYVTVVGFVMYYPRIMRSTSTRNISWEKGGPVHRAHNLVNFMCGLSWNLWSLNLLEPSGSVIDL